MAEHRMFCFQCQETARGTGCTMVGVCGKKPEVAATQDLLIYVTKGLSAVTTELREEGRKIDREVNHQITQNLFMTITNGNFDREALIRAIEKTLRTKDALLKEVKDREGLPDSALWTGPADEFDEKAATVGVLTTEDKDIRSLRELITYGLKGMAAYTKHANVLLQDKEEIDAFLQRALTLIQDDSMTVDDLVTLALETGNY